MMNSGSLARENLQYTGTGGVSANNRDKGFIPAFMDTETGNIYRSCFANGMPAPVHVLAGLPENLIGKGSLDADKHYIVDPLKLRIKCGVDFSFIEPVVDGYASPGFGFQK